MRPQFPIGARIQKVLGILEREDKEILATFYNAVLVTDLGIALLGQSAIVEISSVPEDAGDMPAQVLDGPDDLVDQRVTGAFTHHRSGAPRVGPSGPQLFLVLDHDRLMGVVPTQRGTLLH